MIKKPKLDAHSWQCHYFVGSFSCIDCSQRFLSQPEWKAHTQCITEKEKYHGEFHTPKKKRGGDQSGFGAPPLKKQKIEAATPAPEPSPSAKKKEKTTEVAEKTEAVVDWSSLLQQHLKAVRHSVLLPIASH